MYRFLLTPRWMIVNLIVLLLIPVMFELGMWQWHRHTAKVAENDLIKHNSKHVPVPPDAILQVGSQLSGHDRYRTVVAVGHYDTSHEVFARNRSIDGPVEDGESSPGVVGYYVITPFVTTDGRALLVNRGWVQADGAVDVAAAPPPSGEITVKARLELSETMANSGIRDKQGIPARQVMRIESTQIAKSLPYPVYGGYGELIDQPAQNVKNTPVVIPPPDSVDLGPHLAYAVQWWIFIFAMLGLYVRLVRAEKAELEEMLEALDSEETEDAEASAPAPVTA